MPLQQQLIPLIEQRGFSSAHLERYGHFCDALQSAAGDTLPESQFADSYWVQQFINATLHSEFVQNQLTRHPNWLSESCKEQALTLQDYQQLGSHWLNGHNELESFNRALRQFRNAAMVGIIWRDFNRLVDTMTTTQELTWLAEICVQAAIDYHYGMLTAKHGEPRNNQGELQPLLIIGMGKLGAGELNLSSDIDLIFAYPQAGQTDGPKTLFNQEFFTHLGKRVIQSLDSITADGLVFRVDMRLRPFGQSGALACHFDALEDYYQTQGREWERYAMIKARVIASSLPTQSAVAIEELNKLLTSFTYRKYVDFSVVEALRKLKQLITQEVARRKLGDDVKLGAGGIREIEFIAQAFQLIRGGRDVQLQDNRLLVILPLLEELHCLPEGMAGQLSDAYCFLRNCEHAIQGFQDRQTQKLPLVADQRLSIAQVMGYSDWESFFSVLEAHREVVKTEFAAIIASPESKAAQHDAAHVWVGVWDCSVDPEMCVVKLREAGHEDPQASLSAIQELQQSPNIIAMQPIGRQRLDEFMPQLLQALRQSPTPTATLQRVLPLVRAVARRSAYLLLLIENPDALRQLLTLAQASPWIAEQVTQRPALLDELLDPRSLYHLSDKRELCDELRRSTLRIPEDDEEAQLDALRYFRSAHALRIAACEVSGALPLMQVSDMLTWLAEALLDYVVARSWQDMTARYGYPDGEQRSTPNFIIVGYGKLGGIELGHGSDLDLVFIHNASTTGCTDGEQRGLKTTDNATFYMRLGQKIIHMLTTRMASGELYEVDMRLRPSGNSGMLVATLAAFEKYQKHDAWTWEHQALVRARVVTGDTSLAQQFDDLRRHILSQPRDRDQLRQDVAEMRNKMRMHLGSDKANNGTPNFHLKQDRGGIVDIEFMVQYAVLGWGHQIPALITYTDNIRILECLAQSGILSTQEVDQLTCAYKAFRALGHKLALQQQSNVIAINTLDDEIRAARDKVSALWQSLMQAAPTPG